MAVISVTSKTPLDKAARLFLGFINYCKANVDTRIIFELNNHHWVEQWTTWDGVVKTTECDGYLMIDFSEDFGRSGFSDGSLAFVTDSSDNDNHFGISVRSSANLFHLMYSLHLHGKTKRCYMEGY